MRLYWFSGSGNTLRLAEVFANRLRQSGWKVELCDMAHSPQDTFDSSVVLGLAFPTHCFSIPELVRKFINNLPNVEKTPVVYLGSHGAVSFGVAGHLKKILSRKGFRTLAGRIIRMPDSYFPFFSKRADARRMTIGLKQAEQYADDFNAGRAGWFRVPILSDALEIFFSSFFACRRWTNLSNTSVHSKQSLCRGCGRCVQFCPVHALQLQENGRIGVPARQCVNCLRCVAICPNDAMRHLIGFSPWRGEPSGEYVERLQRNR